MTVSARAILAWRDGLVLTGLLFCVSLGFGVWQALRTFHSAGYAMDEGVLLVYPERIAAGEVPGRDFEYFYGPANLWILAAAFLFGGPSVEAERIVGLAYRAVLIAAVFLLLARRSVWLASLGAVITGLCMATVGGAAYAWYGGLALLGVSLVLLVDREEGDRGRRLAGGLACGAAVLFRQDLLISAALLMAMTSLPAGRAGRIAQLGGFALGVGPYAVLAVQAGPLTMWRSMVLDPTSAQAARRLPIPPANDETAVLFLLVLAGIVGLALASWSSSGKQRSWYLAMLGVSAGLLPQMLQRADLVHVMYVGAFALALVPLLAWELARRASHAALAYGLSFVAALAILAIVDRSADTNVAVGVLPGIEVEHDSRTWRLVSPQEATALAQVLAEVERISAPGDRLVVAPADLRRTNYNDSYIYYLLPELEPGTFFIEMNPGASSRRNGRLLDDLERADVLVLTKRYDDWREPNGSSGFGSTAANEIIATRFCDSGEFGYWVVMRRCG